MDVELAPGDVTGVRGGSSAIEVGGVALSLRVEDDWVVAFAAPRQAVIEHLGAPAGKRIDSGARQAGAPAGPTPVVYAGKPYVARLDSIEIRKERGMDDRRLFAVAFDDISGNRWSYLVAAEREGNGWVADGVAGGSDGPAANRRSSGSATPSIAIYGQWGGDRLYVGGELNPGAAVLGNVRLTLSDGTQVTDDGESGVALFVARRGAQPATVEIFDELGDLLVSRKAF